MIKEDEKYNTYKTNRTKADHKKYKKVQRMV